LLPFFGQQSVWRLRPIFGGPLFRKGRQWTFLTSHAFNADSVHGDDIDPREKHLGSFCVPLAVFCHQCFAELLLNFLVVDDPYSAEHTDALILETRIAFKPAVVKDALLLINLKANAWIPRDVRAEVSSCTGGMYVNFPIDPRIQQGNAIGETVFAHCGETAAVSSCQCLQHTLRRHGPVCATDLRRTHSMMRLTFRMLILKISE